MAPAPYLLFSDLDGTLLDHATYAFDAARPALARIRALGIPLVLCTSKTRAEVEPLRAVLGNTDPFVVENGGAVCIPEHYFPFAIEGAELRGDVLVVPIGDAYDDLVRALRRASRETGVGVRGFAEMSDAEVAAATGLPLADAHRARQREFDEPFEILDAARIGELVAAIERAGKRWTAGGRFHHITGASDKAAAVRLLTSLFRRHRGDVITVGLGDAPNDATFLNVVDLPIVVDSPRAAALHALVPHARVTSRPGPAGWNEAVLALLEAPPP